NAVYLGTPGPDQKCPPDLVGRADTISIGGPGVQPGPATQPTPVIRKTAGKRKTPARADQQRYTPGTIIQDADLHEVALAMPDTAPWIDATYGTDPNLIEQTLGTVRQVSARPARTGDAMHPAV